MVTITMSRYQPGDLRQFDPLQPLDWRWRAAERHHADSTQPAEWHDPLISRALAYLRCTALTINQRDAASAHLHDPDMREAHQLFITGGARRDEVEARLLCEHVQAVSAKTGVSIGALLLFGRIFFNVVDSLTATGWLFLQVVRLPYLHERGVLEGDIWKYWAVGAGPIMLEVLIADHRGIVDPSIPNHHLIAERMRFSVREIATPAHDRAAQQAIIEEGCQRFGPLWGCEPQDRREREILNTHMATLRMAYGLPNSRRTKYRKPSKRAMKTRANENTASREQELSNVR